MERSVMSRSKMERIIIKWSEATARQKGGQKETVWRQGKENGRILLLKAKVYSCFSRARGSLKIISFFLLVIGFKG
jgi:hypothetical protein